MRPSVYVGHGYCPCSTMSEYHKWRVEFAVKQSVMLYQWLVMWNCHMSSFVYKLQKRQENYYIELCVCVFCCLKRHTTGRTRIKSYLVKCFVVHDRRIWNHVNHCFGDDIDQVILGMCLSCTKSFCSRKNRMNHQKCNVRKIKIGQISKNNYRVAGLPVDGMWNCWMTAGLLPVRE